MAEIRAGRETRWRCWRPSRRSRPARCWPPRCSAPDRRACRWVAWCGPAALFGIAEGTVRTALSRMAAAGEVEADDGWYRLSGRLRRAPAAPGRQPVRCPGRALVGALVDGGRAGRPPTGRPIGPSCGPPWRRCASPSCARGCGCAPPTSTPTARPPPARRSTASAIDSTSIRRRANRPPTSPPPCGTWPPGRQGPGPGAGARCLVGPLEAGDTAALRPRLRALRRGAAPLPGRPAAARRAAPAGLAGRRPAPSLRPLRPGLPRPPRPAGSPGRPAEQPRLTTCGAIAEHGLAGRATAREPDGDGVRGRSPRHWVRSRRRRGPRRAAFARSRR